MAYLRSGSNRTRRRRWRRRSRRRHSAKRRMFAAFLNQSLATRLCSQLQSMARAPESFLPIFARLGVLAPWRGSVGAALGCLLVALVGGCAADPPQFVPNLVEMKIQSPKEAIPADKQH